MGAYLSKPEMEKSHEEGENESIRFASTSMQGWRINQEDAHNCIIDFEEGCSLFAVYDGHGGSEVSAYLSRTFPTFLKENNLMKHADLKSALQNLFIDYDETLQKEETVKIMTELKGPVSDGPGEAAEDPEEAERKEQDNLLEEAYALAQEARCPIEQIIKQYTECRNILIERAAKCGENDAENEEGTGKKKKRRVTFLVSPQIIKRRKVQQTNENAEAEVKLSAAVAGKEEAQADALTDEKKKDDDKVTHDGHLPKHKLDDSSTRKAEEINSLNGGTDEDGHELKASEQQELNGNKGIVSEKEEENAVETAKKSTRSRNSAADEQQQQSDVDDGHDHSVTAQPSASMLKATADGEKLPEAGSEEDEEDEDDSDYNVEKEEEEADEEDEEEEADDEEKDGEAEDADGEEGDEEEEENEENLEMLLNKAETGNKAAFDSGSTACVVLLFNDKIVVANIGDSRCVLCRAGTAIELSSDHKPEDTSEKERIEKAGGTVSEDGRVNGGLNLSRAFGDHYYKQKEGLPLKDQMITALPDVTITERNNEDDEFIIVACDGIWNSITSQGACDFVSERIGTKSLKDIGTELCDHCCAKDTTGDGSGCDNETVIIIDLKKCSRQSVPSSADDLISTTETESPTQ